MNKAVRIFKKKIVISEIKQVSIVYAIFRSNVFRQFCNVINVITDKVCFESLEIFAKIVLESVKTEKYLIIHFLCQTLLENLHYEFGVT